MSKEMMSVTRNEVKFLNLMDITIQWQKISILYNIELKTITIQTMTLQEWIISLLYLPSFEEKNIFIKPISYCLLEKKFVEGFCKLAHLRFINYYCNLLYYSFEYSFKY